MELLLDLWPLQICYKHDKEGQTAQLLHDRHGILVALPNKLRSAEEAGQQDNLVAKGGCVCIVMGDGIRNPAIHICIELLLVKIDLVKGRLIIEGLDINNILLEEVVKGKGHYYLPSL